MTPALLICEVHRTFFDNTESFEVVYGDCATTLGTDLAYLYAAIANGDWVHVDPGHSLYHFLRSHDGLFPPGHQVWNHIKVHHE